MKKLIVSLAWMWLIVSAPYAYGFEIFIPGNVNSTDCKFNSINTGVFVNQGDTINITATGSYFFKSGAEPLGPDGNGLPGFDFGPFPAALVGISGGSLIGAIGGPPTNNPLLPPGGTLLNSGGTGVLGPGFVGSDFTEISPISGDIFLSINDSAYCDNSGGYTVTITIVSAIEEIMVPIDIKPGSDPNCFNINGHGVIPVAILGDSGFDVNDIKLESLSFAGLEVRVRGNRGPLCSFEYVNDDEFLDLVCHFEDNADYWSPGDGVADLTGELRDGTPFKGTDSICVVP